MWLVTGLTDMLLYPDIRQEDDEDGPDVRVGGVGHCT
jgi:hypothetical protein